MELADFLRRESPESISKLTAAIAHSSIKVWESIPFNSRLLSGVNPSGEKQKAIDVLSNDIFVESLIRTGAASEVASEEMVEPARGKGKVGVAMDPLDGSSNVDTNNPLGSIFAFYSHPLPCSGRFLLGAAFVTYGPVLTLTLSFGRGVQRFAAVRHGSSFSFELLESNIKLPSSPEVYGFGGLRTEWIPEVRRFVESLEARGLKVRYCGTFVGDYNQVLKRGGIFAYPALRGRPSGKLRVLYETAPMAFITEQAGGYATDGKRSLLDIEPRSLTETTPAYLGSAPLARELEDFISRE